MTELALRNKYGSIRVGSRVSFGVENQSLWTGPTSGILEYNGADFVIKTEGGIITINKGYDAYLNSIAPY